MLRSSHLVIVVIGVILLQSCFQSVVGQVMSVSVSETANDLMNGQLLHHGKCEKITIPICIGNIKYNETIFPNILNQLKQEDAGLDVHLYMPLIKVQCSPDLLTFLCSIYAPVCTILEKPLPPCRSLCLSAKIGCETLMNKFGYKWPEYFDCDKFPTLEDRKKGILCFGQDSDQKPDQPAYTGTGGGGGSVSGAGVAPFFNNVITKSWPKSFANTTTTISRDLGFVCPINFQTPAGMDYVFRVQGKEHKNCGAPCDGLLFNSDQRRLIRVWTGILALVCVFSTLSAVLTYLIDTSRFQYPERPIIYLSLCYFFVGLVYVIGWALGDTVACNQPFPAPDGQVNVQMVRTITQGNKREYCTLLFLILYYFTMASAVWWVILTITWFLSAGLKWSHEAIESQQHYFHFTAWTIPALKAIAVLAMHKVEGDVLTGVCFVSLWTQSYLAIFVLIPLLIYLAIGVLFLTTGFISLWRIRTLMKMDGTFQTDKLEKLMFRNGLFSILYLCPAILLLATYYYEHKNIDSFLLSWLTEVCHRPEFGIPCPVPKPDQKPMKPYLFVFIIKYMTCLMPGITMSFWIWSEKTMKSWAKLFKKIFCLNTRTEAYI
ncbi:frizzled-1-like [Oppia nitens]|uniref:frizzled-1-like n=1 Tax=Oppia nitens TaxID=1686743 RepID=UPI0023D9DD4A|nr:frizzled-1-like [Oppia nitens]